MMAWAWVALLLLACAASAFAQPCLVDELLQDSLPNSGSGTATFRQTCYSDASSLVLDRSWLFTSSNGARKTWDTGFYSGLYTLPSGSNATVTNLALVNVRHSSSSFLSLDIFSQGRQTLRDLDMVTDCAALFSLQATAQTALPDTTAWENGTSYLLIKSFKSSNVTVTNVNITCDFPSTTPFNNTTVWVADSSLSLLNALAVTQQFAVYHPGCDVLLTTNISIVPNQWQWPASTVKVTSNVTFCGQPEAFTILDLKATIGLITVVTPAAFGINDLFLMNLESLRGGTDQQGSMYGLFAIPVWAFAFQRDPFHPKIILRNTTLLLSQAEYDYYTLWALVVTTEVSSISELAAALKASTPIVQLAPSRNRNILGFSRLQSFGTDAFNMTIVATNPSPYPVVTVIEAVPAFSLSVISNVTQVPCYDLADVMNVLSDLAQNMPRFPTALFLWKNITVDPKVWPANGYTLNSSLLLTGRSATSLTYIDFARAPKFVTLAPDNNRTFMYMQWLTLVNLPNSAPSTTLAVGDSSVLTDQTLPLNNFYSARRSASTILYINATSIVVPYNEFKALYASISDLGKIASGSYQQAPVRYNLTLRTSDTLTYQTFLANGLSLFATNVTFLGPAGVRNLYDNVYDPPSFNEAPGPPKKSLLGWQIALIVLGCVAAAVLVAALVSWRWVRHYKKELDVATSADKQRSSEKVSTGSADLLGGRMGGGEADTSQVMVKLGGFDSSGTSGEKAPIQELNIIMHSLAKEINDTQLTVLEVLGQGGFGTVYKGVWKGIVVAVKTITFQDKLFGGDKAQHRAIMEAAISSTLVHPNVVLTYSYDIKPLKVQANEAAGGMTITETVVTDWKLYIIQEYCDAGSLRMAVLGRKFFNEQTKQPRLEMVIDTALELANGLGHLHSKNIIHGDLNPNNVLLKRDSTKKYGAVCKIADFGLSIKMSAGQSHISNMRRGTPFYTGQEVMSVGNMTKAADVFSYGVMLWELYHSNMCYRSHPQHGFQAREVFPSFPRKCPVDYAALATRCMLPEPTQRPTFVQAAEMLKTMLQQAKAGTIQLIEHISGPDPAGDAKHFEFD